MATSAEVPLLGRDRELGRLVECTAHAARGRAAVVAIGGDAGLGKSRLAREVLSRARADGFVTLQGSGGPLQRELSYAPVVEALRPLLRGPAVGTLVDGLSDLARLFDGLPMPRPAALGDAGLERTRLFEAVCGLLRRATRRNPLAVLFEDLHWVDSGSLAMLHYLVRGLADHPVLFVLTHRPGEQGPDLRDLLVALRRADALTDLVLRPLSREAVGALARAVLAGQPPAALLELLADRAGGVPLFVTAFVDTLVDDGSLARSGGRWVLRSRDIGQVPQIVGELLRSRIERLSPAARTVLDTLAIFGGHVSHAVLGELVADESVVLDGVARLRAAHLIDEELTDGVVVYRVSHPLLGEVAYERLPVATRGERHAAAADAVARAAPDDLRGLAFHVRSAGGAMAAERVFDVLCRAAREALVARRGEEAVANARGALAAADQLGATQAKGELLELLAEASERAGRPDDAGAQWLVAAEAAAGDPRSRARCLTRAATVEWDAGQVREAEAHLELAAAVLAEVPAGAEQLVVAETRLRAANRRRDTAAQRTLLAELDRLVELTGSRRAQVAGDAYRADLALAGGDFRTGLAGIRRAVEEADRLGDPLLAEWVRRPASVLVLGRGELASARERAGEGLACARAIGVPTLEVFHRIALGLVDLFAGRWDDALASASDALELSRRLAMARGTAGALALQGLLLTRRGRLDDAASRVAEARRCFGQSSDEDRHIFSLIDQVEVEILLGRGKAASAARLAAESAARMPTLLPVALAALGDAALATGDVDSARATAARLGALGEAPYPAALALRLRGRIDGDAAMLVEAAARLAAAGIVYDEVVTRLDRAELLTGTDVALRAELGRCVEVLDGLRALPQSDRARSLLRRLGERPRPRPTSGRSSGLSAREEQVARLVAQGLSNAEVAARLFISQRTVSTHLQNIYGRLELGSRTALTRYVLERLPAEPRAEPIT